jgi:hypothetical protein
MTLERQVSGMGKGLSHVLQRCPHYTPSFPPNYILAMANTIPKRSNTAQGAYDGTFCLARTDKFTQKTCMGCILNIKPNQCMLSLQCNNNQCMLNRPFNNNQSSFKHQLHPLLNQVSLLSTADKRCPSRKNGSVAGRVGASVAFCGPLVDSSSSAVQLILASQQRTIRHTHKRL